MDYGSVSKVEHDENDGVGFGLVDCSGSDLDNWRHFIKNVEHVFTTFYGSGGMEQSLQPDSAKVAYCGVSEPTVIGGCCCGVD